MWKINAEDAEDALNLACSYTLEKNNTVGKKYNNQ